MPDPTIGVIYSGGLASDDAAEGRLNLLQLTTGSLSSLERVLLKLPHTIDLDWYTPYEEITVRSQLLLAPAWKGTHDEEEDNAIVALKADAEIDLMKKGGSCEWIQPPTMNGVTTSLTLLTMMPGAAGSWRVIRATRFPSRKKVLS